jgi:FkbM family methyltransferase
MGALALNALRLYIRHAPFSKGKHRLLSWLWRPLASGRYEYQTTLRQADVRMRCDISQLIQRHLYFWGGYEEEHCEQWMRLARHSRVIFDVGANVGIYSLLAARANPRASVHAFEPTPAVAELLTNNIELNGLRNIAVNRTGVGDRSGQATLRECRGSNGSNEGMNFVVREAADSESGDLSIPLVSLDDYCQRRGIESVDLMKMDIEGGEYDALVGANRLLRAQAVGCIFLELSEWAAHRGGHSTAHIKSLLADLGYRLYELKAGKLIRMPVEGTHNGENAIALAPGFDLSAAG